MVHNRHILAILIAASLAGIASEGTAAEPHGRAYLFRGLIGLIDWGMDELAGRINRTGVAANIDSHVMWRSVADQAISDYRRDPKPITAIGHSIGGDAAVDFAERLEAAHVPVSLLITYDPNRFAHGIPASTHKLYQFLKCRLHSTIIVYNYHRPCSVFRSKRFSGSKRFGLSFSQHP